MTVLMPPSENASRPLTRYAAPAPMESTPDEFDFSSIFRLLRRRIVLICGVSILLTALAVPAIMGLQPVYHAESRLLIRNSLGAMLDGGDQGRAGALDLPSETERLFSRSISERVVNELKLADLPEFNPALRPPSTIATAREKLRKLVGIQSADGPPLDGLERIIQEYYRALSVRRDAVSGVIQIGFDSKDPLLAAAVPNRLIEIYLDERKRNDLSRLGSAGGLLQRRIAEQQARVDMARAAVTKYRDAAGPISPEAQAEQERSRAALNDQLAKLVESRSQLTAEIDTLASPDRDLSSPALKLPPGIAAMQGELRAQQRSLDQLLQTYGDKADEVISQRSIIASSTAEFALEVDRYARSQRATLSGMDSDIAKLQSAISLAAQQLARAADAQTELAALVAGVDKEQAALDKLELQRRSVSDQADVPTAEVELLSPAAVPLQPQGRGRAFYLIGVLLAAISVAVTVALIREMLDTTVHSHEQLDAIRGLVPAGMLPFAARPQRAGWPAHMRRDQGGLFGESIRTTIVALRQSNGGKLPASIVVTSALDGEGKSSIALSLAMELVAVGQPVLLVECDMMRGNLGAFFNSDETEGLSDYLSGSAKISDVIHHDARTGIDYILRGQGSRFIRSYLPDLSELKKLAQSSGQLLLIDTAPVLASADTIHLAAQSERTLLIVRWAKTRIRVVEFAVQRLREASSTGIMVAINNVNTKKHHKYGYRDSEMYANSLQKYYI